MCLCTGPPGNTKKTSRLYRIILHSTAILHLTFQLWPPCRKCFMTERLYRSHCEMPRIHVYKKKNDLFLKFVVCGEMRLLRIMVNSLHCCSNRRDRTVIRKWIWAICKNALRVKDMQLQCILVKLRNLKCVVYVWIIIYIPMRWSSEVKSTIFYLYTDCAPHRLYNDHFCILNFNFCLDMIYSFLALIFP